MDSFLHNLDWVLPLRSEFLTPVLKGFTFLGYPRFFLFALPVLFWAWRRRAANRTVIIVMISAILNYFLKDLFQDPRPDPSYVLDGSRPDSYGLPSGHTQLAIIFWLSLAFEIRKRWAWICASILIIGIAFSRLYLGVHDVEDILGGALAGGITLILFRLSLRAPFDRWRNLPSLVHPLVATAILALLVLLWPNGSAPGKVILQMGFFVGWIIGAALEDKKIAFSNVSPLRTFGAVLIGFASTFVIVVGLTQIAKAFQFPDFFLQIFGGALTGFFITYTVPWILYRFHLVHSHQKEL